METSHAANRESFFNVQWWLPGWTLFLQPQQLYQQIILFSMENHVSLVGWFLWSSHFDSKEGTCTGNLLWVLTERVSPARFGAWLLRIKAQFILNHNVWPINAILTKRKRKLPAVKRGKRIIHRKTFSSPFLLAAEAMPLQVALYSQAFCSWDHRGSPPDVQFDITKQILRSTIRLQFRRSLWISGTDQEVDKFQNTKWKISIRVLMRWLFALCSLKDQLWVTHIILSITHHHLKSHVWGKKLHRWRKAKQMTSSCLLIQPRWMIRMNAKFLVHLGHLTTFPVSTVNVEELFWTCTWFYFEFIAVISQQDMGIANELFWNCFVIFRFVHRRNCPHRFGMCVRWHHNGHFCWGIHLHRPASVAMGAAQPGVGDSSFVSCTFSTPWSQVYSVSNLWSNDGHIHGLKMSFCQEAPDAESGIGHQKYPQAADLLLSFQKGNLPQHQQSHEQTDQELIKKKKGFKEKADIASFGTQATTVIFNLSKQTNKKFRKQDDVSKPEPASFNEVLLFFDLWTGFCRDLGHRSSRSPIWSRQRHRRFTVSAATSEFPKQNANMTSELQSEKNKQNWEILSCVIKRVKETRKNKTPFLPTDKPVVCSQGSPADSWTAPPAHSLPFPISTHKILDVFSWKHNYMEESDIAQPCQLVWPIFISIILSIIFQVQNLCLKHGNRLEAVYFAAPQAMVFLLCICRTCYTIFGSADGLQVHGAGFVYLRQRNGAISRRTAANEANAGGLATNTTATVSSVLLLRLPSKAGHFNVSRISVQIRRKRIPILVQPDSSQCGQPRRSKPSSALTVLFYSRLLFGDLSWAFVLFSHN